MQKTLFQFFPRKITHYLYNKQEIQTKTTRAIAFLALLPL